MQTIKIIAIFLLLIVGFRPIYAQVTPCTADQQSICVIKMSYDAAGNRIKREQVCTCSGAESRLATTPKTTDIPANNETATISLLQPNPTHDAINVIFAYKVENVNLIVYDATGKQLASYIVSGNEYVLDLATLPSGMYYISLQNGADIQTKKVFKTD